MKRKVEVPLTKKAEKLKHPQQSKKQDFNWKSTSLYDLNGDSIHSQKKMASTSADTKIQDDQQTGINQLSLNK